MSIEWKTYKLGALVKVKGGKRLPKGISLQIAPNTHPYIRIRDMGKSRVLELDATYEYVDDVTQKSIARYVVDEGDILLSIVGTIGLVGIVGKSLHQANQTENCVKLVNLNGIDPLFLYYFLLSPKGQEEIKRGTVGAVQAKLPIKNIENIEISLPPLEEQRRIAGILGAIDDKIECNRRINANLESQAQALYKQWFVDFEFPNEKGKPYKSSGGKIIDSELGQIPEGWSVGTLSDLANVTMGQSPNGKSFNENGDGIVFYQGRTEFGVRYPSIRLYTTEPTRYAEPMSVLLSVRAPVGDINIATQRCCIGRGVASIKSKTDDNAYMYCCLKELRPQLDQYNGEGTVFGSINRKELEGLTLCIPPQDIIHRFNTLIIGMDKQMFNVFQENNNLATLRDTLLPKLMNGEIKIDE